MIKLTPLISSEAHPFTTKTILLKKLLKIYGSPLNIILPSVASHNYTAFKDVFASLGLKNKIYLATKANKSKAILKQMVFTDAYVDVASVNELIDALSAGFAGSRIEATGPKNVEFLKLCIFHNVTINIDDYNELVLIETLHKNLSHALPERKNNIYLRISTPMTQTTKPDRFGIPFKEIPKAVEFIKNAEHIVLQGLSFHISTDKVSDRVGMMKFILDYLINLKQLSHPNLSLHEINIGGGYLINHLTSKAEWDDFQTILKQSVLSGEIDNLTWNKFGLGFSVENGKLKGGQSFSDFYQPINQFDTLKEILLSRHDTLEASYADICKDFDITVCIEPGQSFYDQAGFTLARIINIKTTENNLPLIVLEMNRSNINATDTEYLSDPIIIKNTNKNSSTVTNGFIVGSLCLPTDFISRRRFFFDKPLAVGDILLFTNTAPYLMDFSESQTLKHKVARKIVLVEEDDETNFYEDENYTPV